VAQVVGSSIVCAATGDAIGRAGELIRAGRLVAFPTETVYGLGGDATSDAAVAAIFAAKGRPRFNPLIVHVAGRAEAQADADFDHRAAALADAFWPGPLTLVLPRRPHSRWSLLVSAGLDTVAVRAPAHPVAQALLAAAGRPIAAPSANPSGQVSPTTAAHVRDGLDGKVAMVLDGGACPIGIESTVVDLSGAQPRLLRPGGVPAEALEAVLGPLAGPTMDRPRSPGMLGRHYAPHRRLRLNAAEAGPGEDLLGFGPAAPAGCLNLSAGGNLTEAAANLFAMLRRLDRPAPGAIAVMPIPEDGLGRAINDRLRRAAALEADDAVFNDDRGPAAPCRLPDLADEDE
jgi:L-threonylcarbamoyladenylate synthase